MGCVRVRSGASYVPYLCMDKALVIMIDAAESSLSKLCERLHQGFEEGGVAVPRGGVGIRVVGCSYDPALLDLGSCDG